MAKKNKSNDFVVTITPEEVMYTDISTSKNGYNSASIVFKRADKEYMRVSCEWEGEGIPSFAMDLMGFMKSNSVETSGVWPDKEDAYKEFSNKDKTVTEEEV